MLYQKHFELIKRNVDLYLFLLMDIIFDPFRLSLNLIGIATHFKVTFVFSSDSEKSTNSPLIIANTPFTNKEIGLKMCT